MLIFDKFFLKYEGRVKLNPPSSPLPPPLIPEKLPSKSPALLGLRSACLYYGDKDVHKPSFLTFSRPPY